MMNSKPEKIQTGGLLWQRQCRSAVLADHIRQEIIRGELKAGDRVATVRALAASYEMSINTVRDALSQLVSEGLLEDRSGKKYVQKLSESFVEVPKPGRRQVVLLVESGSHFYNHVYMDLTCHLSAQGIEHVTIPFRTIQDPAALEPWLQRWAQQPPHAIVVGSHDDGLEKKIHDACGNRTRMIFLLRHVPAEQRGHHVGIDYEQVGRMAADYFLARGHRRIGLVTYQRLMDSSHAYNRYKRLVGHTPLILSLGRELRNAGLRHSLTVCYCSKDEVLPTDPNRILIGKERVEKIKQWLSQSVPPTAVIGADFRLVAVTKAAGQLEKEPLDLLGIGQTPWSEAYGFASLNLQPELFSKRLSQLIEMDDDLIRGTVFEIKVPARLTRIEKGELL